MKNKKKSVAKKTWMIDCRTDGAINFAVKNVLGEAKKSIYEDDVRINFTKIAFMNLCETIARAQTNPTEFKLQTVVKVAQKGLTEIVSTLEKIFKSYSNMRYKNTPIVENRWSKPVKVIKNPYDYIDISYEELNEIVSFNRKSDVGKNMTKNVCLDYSYPKIYIYSTDNKPNPIIELLPTNDVRILLSSEVISAWNGGGKIIKSLSLQEIAVLNIKNALENDEVFHIYEKSICNEDNPYYEYENIVSTEKYGLEPIRVLLSKFIEDKETNKIQTAEIGITAYRLGDGNPIIDMIIKATNLHMKCKIFIEMSARGEAFRNLQYIERLLLECDRNYLDLKYHYNDIKVHGKMMYIDFILPNDKKRTIGIFSTGNYNFQTATTYKDYHLVTTNPAITSMVHHNFDMLWNNTQPVLSSISNIIVKEIYKEIAKGSKGRIWIQTNHLDNKLIVDLLKESVKRKVDVKLIVRTTKGFHKKELFCKTVTGVYLEHARVYIFGDNVYLSSSDLLFRNLYNRFESYVKISNRDTKSLLMNDFIKLYKDGQFLPAILKKQ